MRVRVRPCAELYANFPDDMIEEDGEIIQFGGRGVAEAIATSLKQLGYDVSAPEHQQEHGWDFNVKAKRWRVWMQVQDLGDVFILDTVYHPDFWKLNVDNQPYGELLTKLNAEFGNDPRFVTVKWRVRDDVLSERPGAEGPIIE